MAHTLIDHLTVVPAASVTCGVRYTSVPAIFYLHSPICSFVQLYYTVPAETDSDTATVIDCLRNRGVNDLES